MPGTSAVNTPKNTWLLPYRDRARTENGADEEKPARDDQRGGDLANISPSCNTNVPRSMSQEPMLPLHISSPTQSTTSRYGVDLANISAYEANAPLWRGPRPTSASTHASSEGPLTPVSGNSGSCISIRGLELAAEKSYGDYAWSTESTPCQASPDRARTHQSPAVSSELVPQSCATQRFSTHGASSMNNKSIGESYVWLSSNGFSPPREWDEGDVAGALNQAAGQSQQEEYESHPGHQYWEWVDERQKWRRRGTEDEWFPDFIA